MSFLLTPVALISPLFCASLSAFPVQTASTPSAIIDAPHQQAVSRMTCDTQGKITVNVGTSGIDVYPVHYLEERDNASRILFAVRLLGDYTPQRTHVWIGNMHTRRVSSSSVSITAANNGLQLISLAVDNAADIHWDTDRLCISFETEHGTREMAEIQLSGSRS